MNEFVPLLDNRVRDVKKFREKIRRIPMRVIVEGTRGKSSTVRILEEMMRGLGKKTFAKVTGEQTPLLIYNGVVIPLYRKRHSVLLDYETIPTILNFDVDAVVIENQAITPYTMRYLHQIVKPQHVIIPNIRVDHNETLGTDLEEMTHNFVNNYRTTTSRIQVYYGEPLEEIRRVVLPILSEFAEKHPEKMKLHTIKIPPRSGYLCGIENYLVDKYFIEYNFGIKIDEVEYVGPARSKNMGNTINEAEYVRRTENNLKIRKNSQGIRYLNLAKVNDPYSFLQALSHVIGQTEDPVALVGYFRPDRVGRTQLFEHILSDLPKEIGPRIKQVWLAGFHTELVYSHLPPAMQEITHPSTDITDIDSILSHVRKHNMILITMVNRVNPFMDKLVDQLQDRESKHYDSDFKLSDIHDYRKLSTIEG
jgi:hypothetical protein